MMLNRPKLWLGLSLASLAITVSLVTVNGNNTMASPFYTIARTKSANVGGPLAKQLQGKPVVVDIYATWCPKCQNVAPTLSQLKQEYNGKANFVVLNVTDNANVRQSESRAKQLGLGKFFSENRSQTGLIAIIDPATGNILAQYRNNPKKADYTAVLNTALSRK